MILYHGSTVEIHDIDLNKSARGKDFGKGFYLSENEKQAEEMAVFKSLQTDSKPIVNAFDFDERLLHENKKHRHRNILEAIEIHQRYHIPVFLRHGTGFIKTEKIMTLTKEQIKMMQEDMYAELIQILMEKYGYTLEEAMDTLYNSDTFAKLQDSNTGLYYQSAGYVYSFLNSELSLCDYRK